MDISYLPTDLTSTIVFKTVYLVFNSFSKALVKVCYT